jgi:Spy/CpxP family protein refolding chaperone
MGLGLTDAQRDQIRALFDQHKAEFQTAHEAARTAREAQQTALDAATLDEGAVRAAATTLASAEADVLILTAKVKAEALQLLTPEQLTKLQERKAERAKMRAEFEQRRQQKKSQQ